MKLNYEEVTKCVAVSEKGEEFHYNILVYQTKDGKYIISFGRGPCSYYLTTLLEHKIPYEKKLCIDIMGRNHSGSPVNIEKEVLNKVIETTLQYIKGTIMYCHKDPYSDNRSGFFYDDISLTSETTRSYNYKKSILKVLVRKAEDDESTEYNGWWDFKENKFTMVHHSKVINICFPYGYKAEEEAGHGKLYKVIIEDIIELEKEW